MKLKLFISIKHFIGAAQVLILMYKKKVVSEEEFTDTMKAMIQNRRLSAMENMKIIGMIDKYAGEYDKSKLLM